MTEMDKVKIDAVFEVLQVKIKGILSKYMVLCGKAYDFFAMLCRGQRTHTPETLAASQKRGTWIVSLLVAFVVFGALIDDDKVAEGTEERSVESTVAKDASQSNDCNAKMTTDEPLVPEKLTGWIKLPKNVNANISLRNASSPNFKPVKGNVYIHIGAGLKVGQFDGKTAFAHPVNDGLSALANLDAAFSGNAGGINDNDDDHMLAIIARDEYASGEQVRAGAYEYIGVDTYKTVLDANVSLRVFKELPEGKSKEIMNAVISNRKLLNAEYDRREKVKEAASKAAELAKESARIKAFEEMFTAERFDNFIGKVLKSRVVIQRSEQSRLGPLSCRIIDNLRSLAAKGDWGNFCSTIERQTRTMSSKYGTATADECWGNMKLGLDMMGLQANGVRRGYEVLFNKSDVEYCNNEKIDPKYELEPEEGTDNSFFAFMVDVANSEVVFVGCTGYHKSIRVCHVPWRKTFITRLGILKKFCKENPDLLKSGDVAKIEESLSKFLDAN